MKLTEKHAHLILAALILILWVSDVFITPNWTGAIISTLFAILQTMNLLHYFKK
jgi:hypothetical protein